MLHRDKRVNVECSIDVAYGLIGMILMMREKGAVGGGCLVAQEDVKQLSDDNLKLAEDLILQVDAHGYCEHIADAAKAVREKRIEDAIADSAKGWEK